MGPANYNVRDTDIQNSKVAGAKCNAVFGRKPMNIDAREHAHEYIMVGSNVKHAPANHNLQACQLCIVEYQVISVKLIIFMNATEYT